MVCLQSPIGLVWVETHGEVLASIWFDNHCSSNGSDFRPSPSSYTDRVCRQLDDYFAGRLQSFDLSLKRMGTPFQRQAWAELLKIPYGQTISYSDQATAMGRSRAVRAVANANGANPFPIVIPCHRVIQKDGRQGGYSAGIEKKEWLLNHERHHV
jgi:O-6-methylguanine DNA methyltransferase